MKSKGNSVVRIKLKTQVVNIRDCNIVSNEGAWPRKGVLNTSQMNRNLLENKASVETSAKSGTNTVEEDGEVTTRDENKNTGDIKKNDDYSVDIETMCSGDTENLVLSNNLDNTKINQTTK